MTTTTTTESTDGNAIHTKAEGVTVYKIRSDQPAELEAAIENFREQSGDWRAIVSYIERVETRPRTYSEDLAGDNGGPTLRYSAELVSVQDIIDGKV